MAANSNRLRGALLASTALVAGVGGLAPGASTALAQNILPTNGVVTSGAASIRQSGAGLSVFQTSPRAIVNWGSFSIGPANGVTFDQPNASSAILNRVTGSTTSTIAGQLQANGQVYLVNPNGIAITKSGAVQVGGGFVASTLGIADSDFNNGNLNFVGKGASAGVSNAGSITAAPGGFVGLLGGTVANSGVVSVPLGKVAMGSGEQATLNLTGDNFLQVAVPTDTKTADGQALIDVSGKVRAAGGLVQLRAATVAQAIRNAVNVPGALSVTSARASGGSIILGGGPGGNVSVTGRLKASGRNAGGTIAISGHDVALRQAKLAAASAKGRGGAVTVTGTNAVSVASSLVYASGATGGGAIRIGGDFHGASDLTSAQTTTIDSASTLNASATVSGAGGTVAVWSDAATNFAGKITATGGPNGGDGGSVEVSANPATHGFLSYSGLADLTAPKGKTGTLLLDPFNITICEAGAACADSGGTFLDGVFTPNPVPPETSVITTATLVGQLTTANVVVSTGLAGSPGGDEGNLTVSGAIEWGSANSLTLEAADGISINAAITATGAGALTLNAPSIGPETGFVGVFAPLSTTSGAINITGGGAAPLGIELGANVTTTGGPITFNNQVQLQATVAVNAGAGTVRFGSTVDAAPGPSGPCAAGCDLTVTGGGVTFAGNVGSLNPLGALSVTGPATLAGNVTTTGNIEFNNAVTLAANIAVSSGASATSFGGTVDGPFNLTVTGGDVTFGGNVGSVTPLAGLTVFGPTSLGGNVTTTGDIAFEGAVALAANVSVNSGPAGTVAFDGTVDSNSGSCGAGCDLTVSGGAVIFGDDVGSLSPLGALSVTGSTTLFGNVTTTGDIAFNSPVQLEESNTVVNAGGGHVTFGSTIDADPTGCGEGGCDLTVSGGLVTFGGNIGSDVPLAGLNVTGPVQLRGDVSIDTGDGDVSFSGTVDSAPGSPGSGLTVNAGSIDLGGALGATSPLGAVSLTPLDGLITLPSITATGDITIGDTTTNDTTVLLNGNIATSGGSIAFAGPVFLQTSVAVTAPTGAVGFASTVDAGFSGEVCAACDLTVNASTINFGGDLGSQNGGADPFNAVFLTSTNLLTLPSISAGALTAASTAGGITLSGPLTIAGTAALNAAGDIVQQAGATIDPTDLTMISTAGGITLNTSVTASGGVTLTAADDIIETTEASISAPTLTATSSTGRVVLGLLGNAVGSVSGSAPGGFSFFNTGAFDVGGAGIASSGGSIALETIGGSITQTGPLQGAALFARTGLDGSGNVVLTNPNNAIGTLAGVAGGGSFQFANGNGAGLTIGTVNFFTSSEAGPPVTATGAGVTSTAEEVAGAEIQVSTTGTLVLDSPVQGSIPDGLIQLAATANFINNVGPAAVVDPWQVYSASPTGDIFGDLDSGNTAVWNTTFGQPVTAAGNRYIFAFRPTITVTSGDLTKTYGQDVTSLVAADFTISGLQPGVAGAFLGDTAAAVFSGTPSVTSLGSPANASVAGSPYAITVAPSSFAVSDGYTLALDSAGRLTIDPLALTYTVADTNSIFGTTPILGAATLFGVLPGDIVDPTVGAFRGPVQVSLNPFTPVGQYVQMVTALSNPNYVIAGSGNSPGTLTVAPAPVAFLPFDPGFLPGLTQINNPAQTEYDVGGYEQVLPHFTVACNEPPSLPDPNRFSDPDQALRALSQSMENYFRRCQNPTQATIADALDAYAAKLQVLAPRLPPALRNVPAIVAEGAKRVRAARSRTEAMAVLRQTVAEVHKEIALVLSEDPQTRSREIREGDVIAGALGDANVALVNSGGL